MLLKKTIAKRRCEVCNRVFTPKRRWQKYHGQTCRMTAYRHRTWALLEKAREAGLTVDDNGQ